ncbi:MAG: hypothetical protein V1644_01440 [Candidatus Micrarchaeota archaeon]
MKSLTLVAIVLFFVAFAGVYFYNSSQAENNGELFQFKPPYAFVPGDMLSTFNAFFFVFIVSLLLFGMGSVVSMPLEGLKYGTLFYGYVNGVITGFHFFDLLFVIPQLMACVAATTLAAGLILDYRGKTSLFPYWNSAVRYFAFGLFITIILLGIRPFLVGL